MTNRRYFGSGDGAWCVCPDRLDERSIVYSFGVGYDVSFDVGLIEVVGCEVHAFDPTPLSARWVRRQRLPQRFHFHDFGVAGFNGTARFALPETHEVSFTLLDVGRPKMVTSGQVRRLPTILGLLGHEKV